MRHTNYDEIAARYDRRYAEEDYSGIERALLDFVAGTQTAVAEVGSGTGHWLRVLQGWGVKAVGVDLSWQMLVHAAAKLAKGYCAQAQAEGLPFRPRSFDRLFSINAHHHFSDKRRFLREHRRVLRPAGSMMTIALDPHTGTDQWWVYEYFDGTLDIDRQRYPSCEQLRAWMRDAGFSNVYTREVQHLPGDITAREALQKGFVSCDHTSQLAVLTAEEFERGMARIRAAVHGNDALHLSADLRVYATYGTIA